jgi:hypothetical protein
MDNVQNYEKMNYLEVLFDLFLKLPFVCNWSSLNRTELSQNTVELC